MKNKFNKILKIEPIYHKDYRFLNGKNILITGAAGSIGSYVLKEIDEYNYNNLIAIDFNETGLSKISKRLKNKNNNFVVGDIKNTRLIKKYLKNIDIVIHTAAFKHVELVEKNVEESLLNNFVASIDLIDMCLENNVKYFANTSSDKSVKFESLMGAIKKNIENYITNINKDPDIHYFSSRFGNVFSSRGSIYHIFKHQLENSIPLTITDLNMIIIFITPEESTYFLLFPMEKYTDISLFTCNEYKEYKVIDLIKNMAEYFGIPKYSINEIGIRDGEKLFEELIDDNERYIEINQYISGIKNNSYIHQIDLYDYIKNNIYTIPEEEIKNKFISETK